MLPKRFLKSQMEKEKSMTVMAFNIGVSSMVATYGGPLGYLYGLASL